MVVTTDTLLRRLAADAIYHVEVESKHRIAAEDAGDLRDHLLKRKRVHHKGHRSFYDQFLDTPKMDLHRLGVSLRLRYKDHGANVYLQYKGPGFHQSGLLFRSEYSSGKLKRLTIEEDHHRLVHVAKTSVQDLLQDRAAADMRHAMHRHLGEAVIARITAGPIICMYQKDKFLVDLGEVYLEPSVDKVVAFFVNPSGPHMLSTFCEYENEVKDHSDAGAARLDHLPELLAFDRQLVKQFDLKPDRLDKYHRSAACFKEFLPLRRGS